MKRLKIGFAAIIAILAISVTVASHAGAFKAKSVADCNTVLTAYTAANCNNVLVQLISQSTLCSEAIPADEKFAILGASNQLIDATQECTTPNTVFCCAKVQPITPSPANCFRTHLIKEIVCGTRVQ